MTKTIAKFSNGFKDEYKGARDVRAAWMITNKATGEVLASGHSLDRANAQKTADGNVRFVAAALTDHRIVDVPTRSRAYPVEYKRSQIKQARALSLLDDAPKGKLSPAQLWGLTCDRLRAYSLEALAAKRAAVNVEVIDI